MSIDPQNESAAARLSGDTDASGRIISDDGDVAEAAPAPSRVTLRKQYEPSWLHTITSKYALVVVWFVMALVFYALMPDKFGTGAAFTSIFGSQQVLVFLAMAALVTLVVGEFDLSIASIMGLSATMVTVLAGLHGVNIWVAVAIALAASVICGAVNAFFVVVLEVSSFVVTLGTGTLLLGLAEFISGSNIVSVSNDAFSNLSNYRILGMPASFYYGIALGLIIAYILAFTPLGRHMIFVGSSREVARLAGIPVQGIRAGAYMVGGLLSGMAGVILVSTVGGFSSSSATIYLLPALAAVFLGTAVVQPGMFNPIGTLIAIYFLATGIFGLQLLGFSGWIQNVFYGAGLVIAVALAKIVRNRAGSA